MAVAVGVSLAALAWQLVRAGMGAEFVIRRFRGGRVAIRGRIPRARHGAIREFFNRDLAPVRTFAVFGARGPGRIWRLRWLGRVAPGDRQRIRNFLLKLLD